ncbi:unnamed protein product [Nippostrongylus brasiliensis]|uniref:Uncharacterized protein n=1 Tax=Nippostrongylus brasiliensis TaxID=27835 RepID=A0A0N4XRH0_NIPBR|nr:unnamed protein product [Nippostrongylus brasiliensis]
MQRCGFLNPGVQQIVAPSGRLEDQAQQQPLQPSYPEHALVRPPPQPIVPQQPGGHSGTLFQILIEFLEDDYKVENQRVPQKALIMQGTKYPSSDR